MNDYFDYIKDILLEEFDSKCSKIVLYAEFDEGTAASFVRYSKSDEPVVRGIDNTSQILNVVASVRKTQIHNGLKKIWSGLIYILNDNQSTIKLLYDDDIDRNDMLMVAVQKKIHDEYFPNMSYKSD